MDSRQGGSDGVSTDGILTPALPTGILQSACVSMCGSTLRERQMDRKAEMDANMLSGAPCRLKMYCLFVSNKRMIMQIFQTLSCMTHHQYSSFILISTNAFPH